MADTSFEDAVEMLDRALAVVPMLEAERVLNPSARGCPRFHLVVYRLAVAMKTTYGHDMETCIGRVLQAVSHWCDTHRYDLRESAGGQWRRAGG